MLFANLVPLAVRYEREEGKECFCVDHEKTLGVKQIGACEPVEDACGADQTVGQGRWVKGGLNHWTKLINGRGELM